MASQSGLSVGLGGEEGGPRKRKGMSHLISAKAKDARMKKAVATAKRLLRETGLFTPEWIAAHQDQGAVDMDGNVVVGVTFEQFSAALNSGPVLKAVFLSCLS
eukprot:SAG31_NODE_59_length_29571_cov_20.443506_6_plen_103_part_00